MDKRKPIIFIDFDGTLIDISKRHYKVYREIVNQLNGQSLSYSTYWILKRNNTKWPDILKKSLVHPNNYSLFVNKFISRIELEKNLSLDLVFPYAHKALDLLYNSYYLYLTSLRHSMLKIMKQLNNLGLKKYFKKIIISPNKENIITIIDKLIRKTNNYSEMKNLIAGDTEDQVIIGKRLGIVSIVFLSGIRNKRFLAKYHPDFIIKNVHDLPRLVNKLCID